MPADPTGSTVRILVTALGGEGGGVLMNWLVQAARTAGLAVQATSVPGVAQRTGATSYYIEIGARRTADDNGLMSRHAFNLMPLPGRVDIVLASELVEAARAMEAGYVSPARTTLVASLSRTYATAEKIAMTDGRYNIDAVAGAAQQLAQHCVLQDLQQLAEQHGTYISATLFGAVAATGALPWSLEVSRDVLASASGNDASLSGFDAAAQAAGQQTAGHTDSATPGAAVNPAPRATGQAGDSANDLETILSLATERLTDYQDPAYATLFRDRIAGLRDVVPVGDPLADQVVIEAARRLANWMAYEDIARVADLKTRAKRFMNIRAESNASTAQLVRVTDYLKPRGEEIADILPVAWGQRLLDRVQSGKRLPFLGQGRRIVSNAAWGYWLLRLAAGMKRWRRQSLRYRNEQRDIEAWLTDLRSSLPRSAAFALSLAELPRVRKGYSDTLQRGLAAYSKITDTIVRPAIDNHLEAQYADELRVALQSAFSDDKHSALNEHIVRFERNAGSASEMSRPAASVGAGD